MFDGGGDTFMGLPRRDVADASPAKVAVLGADTATPYASVGAYCARGADAIREASAADAGNRGHVNFDTGDVAIPEGFAVDCANIPTAEDHVDMRSAISAAVTSLSAQGVVPILLGGDDSIPIPVIAALGPDPLWIVQIDAHIDWRSEVGGERWGLSSTMRRASEMNHVAGIIQIGQRGLGSARPADRDEAVAWGAHLYPARSLIRNDPLSELPDQARVAVVFDFDALDPSIMPALIAPTAGGLDYWQVVTLFERIAARANIEAITMCEFMASRDRDRVGATLGAQLLTTWIGVLAAKERHEA